MTAPTPLARQNVVTLLRDKLAEAEAGRFVSIAFAAVYRRTPTMRGGVNHCWAADMGADCAALQGAVARLAHMLNRDADELVTERDA